jgi:hypothetical protein
VSPAERVPAWAGCVGGIAIRQRPVSLVNASFNRSPPARCSLTKLGEIKGVAL